MHRKAALESFYCTVDYVEVITVAGLLETAMCQLLLSSSSSRVMRCYSSVPFGENEA